MKKKMQFIYRNWERIFVCVFLLTALAVILFKGENLHIQVWDNLDSNVVWRKMLKDNDLFWKLDATVPFLGGISRNLLGSEWKAYTWLYQIFSPFTAMIIGWFLKILMATTGFCAVGRQICDDYEHQKGTVLFCGFLYGLLPMFPTAAFAFASLPWLLWLLIKLYREKKKGYLLAIFLYPIFSAAATFGVFACGYIFCAFVIDWIVNKKPAWRMLAAVFVLGLGYMATEWRLFYSMLLTNDPSIRYTFASSSVTLEQLWKDICTALVTGHDHSQALHTWVVLPICSIYFVWLNISYIRKKHASGILKDPFNWLMAWIIVNCVIYGIDGTRWFKEFLHAVLPPLSGLNFARTLWFNGFAWYFAFMLVLCRIKIKPVRMLMLLAAFLVVCAVPAKYNHIQTNLAVIKHDIVFGGTLRELSYKEFYSEDLFSRIKEEIDYDGEWSVAYGMHPAVLQYNGIATLDGYISTYPAEYKEQFRKLIAPELAVNEAKAKYYDEWGGRAYVFSSDVSYAPRRRLPCDEAVMRIDPQVFREMEGKYVFSRVSISNAEELCLEEVGIYTGAQSQYTIHVYRLTDNDEV